MGQRRQKQKGDNVGDLDHRIDGRTGGILVGIADRITRHRGLVGVAALAAVIAVLDELLGVVPGTPATGHRYGEEKSCSIYGTTCSLIAALVSRSTSRA